MSYYDEQFIPWQIVDGKCVVANEAEWDRLKRLSEVFMACPCCKHIDATADVDCGISTYVCHDCRSETPQTDWFRRPIVKVPTDIFEDVTLCPVDIRGTPIGIADWLGDNGFGRSINHGDLLTRTFQTIDATPHVDYLLMTQRPELVRKSWAPYMPQGWWDTDSDANSKFREDEPKIRKRLEEAIGVKLPDARYYTRKSVTLATYVQTQNDIERLIPELLKCHDLCKGMAVVCNPKEKLDFRKVKLIPGDERFNVLKGMMIDSCGGIHKMGRSLDLIIAEGNDHPIHPDWLRFLRDQCKDANVPFNFSSWGSFIPSSCVPPCPDTGHYLWPWKDQGDETMVLAIDKDKSGRLLDGQEHNGRIE